MALAEKKDRAYGAGKRTRVAANVVTVSILALLLAIFANVGIDGAARRTDLRFDLTQEKFFRLQESTKTFLRRLDRPIEIYLVYGIDDPIRAASRLRMDATVPDTGLLDSTYRPLLRYIEDSVSRMVVETRVLGTRLELNTADADRNADDPVRWAKRLGLGRDELLNHLVLYDPASRRKKSFSFYDVFDFDLGGPDPTRGHIRPDWHGDHLESYLVHGLESMLEREERTAYFASGRAESSLPSFRAMLEADGFVVKALVPGEVAEVPEDCDLLVAASPELEWEAPDLDRLKRFLDRGGRLMVTQGRRNLEFFDRLFEGYGFKALRGQVGQVSQSIVQLGRYHLVGHRLLATNVDGRPHPIVAAALTNRLNFSLGFCRGYELLKDFDAARVDRFVLARSGEGGQLMPWIFDGRDWRQAEERGTAIGDYPLLLAAERRPADASVRPSRIVVAGSDEWLDRRLLTAGNDLANLEVLGNAVNWLTDAENLIVGKPRAWRGKLADLDEDRAKSFFWISVAIVPAILTLIGILTWLVRRR